jgi:hypothetical protein
MPTSKFLKVSEPVLSLKVSTRTGADELTSLIIHPKHGGPGNPSIPLKFYYRIISLMTDQHALQTISIWF